jgi:hypothetical protein
MTPLVKHSNNLEFYAYGNLRFLSGKRKLFMILISKIIFFKCFSQHIFALVVRDRLFIRLFSSYCWFDDIHNFMSRMFCGEFEISLGTVRNFLDENFHKIIWIRKAIIFKSKLERPKIEIRQIKLNQIGRKYWNNYLSNSIWKWFFRDSLK